MVFLPPHYYRADKTSVSISIKQFREPHFSLCHFVAKIGGTSEMKIKIFAFYFAFHSVCTNFVQ